MRRIGPAGIVFGVLLMLFSLPVTSDTLHIDRIGKRIQVDGFPLEWDRREAHLIGGIGGIRIDALNTPDGLSGVVWYGVADSCEELTLSFTTAVSGNQPVLSFRAVGNTSDGENHAVSEEKNDGFRRITSEWVIPSAELSSPRSERYIVNLHAYSACGDTLSPVTITGTREASVDEFLLSPMMLIQALAIVILLALYLNLRSRSKRYRR